MSCHNTYDGHISNLKWLSIKQKNYNFDSCPGIQNYAFQYSKLHVSLVGSCFTSVRYVGLQGDPPQGTFLYTDHTKIRSLPKALDSRIIYQHPFELSQTSRH